MEKKRHRLLDRQIKKYLKEYSGDNPCMENFIAAINEAYCSFEEDHNSLERTLEISSQELYKANQVLNDSKKNLEETVKNRTKELLTSNEKLVAEINERTEAERMLKAYAMELENKNNELDKFAYIVSHDLKAPLRAISSLSDWIMEDIGDKFYGESMHNFELLKGRAARMESLINGILEYARVGKIRTAYEEINTYNFVNEVVESLRPPENFKIKIEKDLPQIVSEKVALNQIFSNYISNAIKYNNNPNPLVSISYMRYEGRHVYCVADNGEGIDPNYHEKVFVIFQTLQARDTLESTGVGLAIVKKVVNEMGGKVWIDSELGSGARFYFSLPI